MFTTSAAPSGPGRGTALMRALSLLFAGAVAFATLYPLVDWRLRAQGAFAFLLEGLPRYWTWFDVLSNAFAYGVLGLLLTLGWLTRATPPAAFASVTLACSLMSLGLEAAQTYLPARVPSLLDWIANTLGGAAGAWLGATLNRAAQRSERLAVPVRELWYEQGPPTGWVLLLLWLAAQLVPQRLLFATGHVEPALQRMLDRLQPADRPDLSRLVGWLWGEAAPTGYGVAIEAGVVVCAVCTVGAIAFALVQGSRRRLALIAGIALFAFGLRSLAVGAVLLYGLETLGPRLRAAAGVATAAAGVALVNLVPDDQYFDSMVATVQVGQLSNLHGLLRIVSFVWPLLAIVWFSRRTGRAGLRSL
jgi:VanZ family protein